MNAPVYWMSRIDEYLTYRRSLGFGLKFDETVLRSFAKFALKTGPHAHLTVKLATDWARSSQRSEPGRGRVVSRFCAALLSIA